MGETERLEQQLQKQEDNRRKAESDRKKQDYGSVEHAIDEQFREVQKQIAALPKAEQEILVHLRVAEDLVPVAKAYDEATRNVLAAVTEYNVEVRSKEIKVLAEKLEELGALSNGVLASLRDMLASLRDIIVRLDRFAGNLELEREVLLAVKAELTR